MKPTERKRPEVVVDLAESLSEFEDDEEKIESEVASVMDATQLHGLVLEWQEKLWDWHISGVQLTKAEENSLADFKAVLRDVDVCKTLVSQLQGDDKVVVSKTFCFPNPNDSTDVQSQFVLLELMELEVFTARMRYVFSKNAVDNAVEEKTEKENELRSGKQMLAAAECDLKQAEASLKVARAGVQNERANARPTKKKRNKMRSHRRPKRSSSTTSQENRFKDILFRSSTFIGFRALLFKDLQIKPPLNVCESRFLWNCGKHQISPVAANPEITIPPGSSSYPTDVVATPVDLAVETAGETVRIGQSADESVSGIVTPESPGVSPELTVIVAVDRQQSASPKTENPVQLSGEYPPPIGYLNDIPADRLQQETVREKHSDGPKLPATANAIPVDSQLSSNVKSISVVDDENDLEAAVADVMEYLLWEVSKNADEKFGVDGVPKESCSHVDKSVSTVNCSNSTAVKTEGIIIRTEEKLSIEMSRDGHLNSLDLNGLTTLKVSDDKSSRIRIKMQNSDRRGAQLQTHPNLDKELFRNDSVLALKNPQKPFPINSDVGVLKWRVRSQEQDSLVPMSINCWPTETGNGCDVNIEYTLEMPDLELQDVVISIPLPSGAAPVVKDCDGEYKYERVHNWLDWKLPVVNRSNKTGSLEFSTSTGHPDNFFPIRVQFHSQIQYCDIVPTEVIRSDDNSPAKYSFESILLTEKFEVV